MTYFSNIKFANIYFLYLLILIPVLIFWYWYKFRNKNHPDIMFADIAGFKGYQQNFKVKLYHFLNFLKIISIALLVIVLARPQSSLSKQDINIEGIDLVIALDISGSMLAEDFKPNRLEVAKTVGIDFINGRDNDRIGLVVFSGESFTQCPLTTDHDVLINLFSTVKTGMIEDGTAIGDGLATAVNRLRNSSAISKVIILLTDGVNNMGMIDPLTAAQIAARFNIRVYTIGVGGTGPAPYPFQTQFGIRYQNVDIPIDENLLKSIAQTANGQYFRATNKNKLEEIYKEINELEKTKIDVTEFKRKKEEFLPYLLISFLLLIIDFIVKSTYLKMIP